MVKVKEVKPPTAFPAEALQSARMFFKDRFSLLLDHPDRARHLEIIGQGWRRKINLWY